MIGPTWNSRQSAARLKLYNNNNNKIFSFETPAIIIVQAYTYVYYYFLVSACCNLNAVYTYVLCAVLTEICIIIPQTADDAAASCGLFDPFSLGQSGAAIGPKTLHFAVHHTTLCCSATHIYI